MGTVREITDTPKPTPTDTKNVAVSPGYVYYNAKGGMYVHDEQKGVHHQITDTPIEVLSRWEHAQHPDDRRFERRTGVHLRIFHRRGAEDYYLDSTDIAKSAALDIWLRNRGVSALLLPGHGPSALSHLSNALSVAAPESRQVIHTRNGWNGDYSLYVAGSETIPAREGHAGNFRVQPALGDTRGTLEEWQTKVAKLLIETNHWGHQWAATVPLAALLIPIVPLPKTAAGGFHIHGGSSRGKSTALRVAHSILGDDHESGREYMTWHATSNSLEVVASDYNHRMLPLDEIGQATDMSGRNGSKCVIESAYLLAQGVGKTRTNGALDNIAPLKFDTIFLSSGEHSFESIVFAETRREPMAGQRVRFSDIDWSKDIAPNLTDAAIADLEDAMEDCRGTVGRAFIERVSLLTKKERKALGSRFREIRDDLVDKGADGKMRRVGARFALSVLAAELAKKWGLFPEEWVALDAPKKVYQGWTSANGAIDEGIKACVSLHEYIDSARANGEFHVVCADRAEHVVKGRQAVGFIFPHLGGSSEEGALDPKSGGTGVRLLPKAFTASVFGTSPAIAKRYLREHGILHCKGDRYTSRMTVVRTVDFESREIATSSTKVMSINLFRLTQLLESKGLIQNEEKKGTE